MSHILLVCTDGTRALAIRQDKHFGLPDTLLHGSLEWTRTDARKTAVKLLKTVTYGVFFEAPEIRLHKPCFGLQEHHRLVEIVYAPERLNLLYAILLSVAQVLGKTAPVHVYALVSPSDATRCSIETVHVLRHIQNARDGGRTREESLPQDT